MVPENTGEMPRPSQSIEMPAQIGSFFTERTAPVAGAPSDEVPLPQQPAPRATSRYAIFTSHGMGQQIPFETIDMVVRGVREAAGRLNATTDDIRARTVRVGDETMQRAEIDLTLEGGRKIELHMYEGYWAPFTEGVVTLRDVMSFLYRGALGGIRNSLHIVQRWMFAQDVPLATGKGTGFYFAVTLLVILGLVVLNAVTGIVAASKLFSTSTGAGGWPSGALLNAYTIIAATVSAVTLLYGAALIAMMKLKGKGALQHRIILLCRPLLSAGLGVVCLTIIGSMIAFGYAALAENSYAFLADENWLSSRYALIVVWGFLALTTMLVRTLLVQYPGDVAAYVDSYSLDKFYDVRQQIKNCVRTALEAIYGAEENGAPYYDGVSVLGHSLGSVVAYDALNGIFNKDELDGRRARVIERTQALVTFGSPLDKTAFIFASQAATSQTIREAGPESNGATTIPNKSIREMLATSTQPLIQDYEKYRRFTWINIWSRYDIISGDLDYYDCASAPGATGRTVKNIEDPDAMIPIVAHVEYWHNPLVFDELMKVVVEV
jgi:hypothetical protein